MVWLRGLWSRMVGEVAVWTIPVPEGVGGVVDVVEVPGGCPWRCGGRDGEPLRSLLEACTVCKEGRTHSEEATVPAVVRDRGVSGGAATLLACSCRRSRVFCGRHRG